MKLKFIISILLVSALFASCKNQSVNKKKKTDTSESSTETSNSSNNTSASNAVNSATPVDSTSTTGSVTPPVTEPVSSPVVVRTPADEGITYCPELVTYNGSNTDSSAVVQACINKTPNGKTLAIPAGKYTLVKEVIVNHSMTMTTLGRYNKKCAEGETHDCVEFRANADTYTEIGFFKVISSDVTIDQIVINGNKEARYDSPAGLKCKASADYNVFGMNTKFYGSSITISNSVFKNALCGTSLYLIEGANYKVNNNTISNNGQHDKNTMWSDGLTAFEISNSDISSNSFVDNTDVDLIFGACPNCTIRNNTVVHYNNFKTSSFAGIMIQSWPNGGSSGNYTGADIAYNTVDCSVGQRCGFGIYVGQSAWYEGKTYGGNVHNNSIVGAQQGFAVDKVTGFKIANNQVFGSMGTFQASCGKKYFSAFVVTPGTVIDRTGDLIPDYHYVSFPLDGCIPNDWKYPY